jgi:hypothetical protein
MPAVEGDEESIGTSGMTIADSSRVGGPISLHTAIEATSSSAKHKLCCRMEAEQGKEFWRRLFGGKISCDGGDTPGTD